MSTPPRLPSRKGKVLIKNGSGKFEATRRVREGHQGNTQRGDLVPVYRTRNAGEERRNGVCVNCQQWEPEAVGAEILNTNSGFLCPD